jgi:hypothetical protein
MTCNFVSTHNSLFTNNWETPQAQEVAAIVDALTWTKGTRGAAESGSR